MVMLNEMFSPLGGANESDQDIDWIGDLKFFIDNDEKMLENYFFPAVEKHRNHLGNPNAYKLYVRSIKECMKCYVEQYKIESANEKFTEDSITDLAKNIAEEQERFIKEGDYDADL
jgi:hypothetical protein